MSAVHEPLISRHSEGWGVYCAACSVEAQHYVFPCKVRVDDMFPETGVLVERDRLINGPYEIESAPDMTPVTIKIYRKTDDPRADIEAVVPVCVATELMRLSQLEKKKQ